MGGSSDDVGGVPLFHLRHRHFTYVTAHSLTLPPLYLHHSSFPTLSPLHLPHRHFTYVTAHSLTLPSLHLHHTSFSNTSAASPMSQLTLQSFRRFTYVTVKGWRMSCDVGELTEEFSNHCVTSRTSQLISQHFCHFTYVTAHSPTLSSFIYVTGTSPTSPGKQLML